MPPRSVSARGIDKNSRLADTTPNIKFFSPDKYDFPVIALNCTNAVGTILVRQNRDAAVGTILFQKFQRY